MCINQVFARLVALTVFSHYNWIVHLGTIYYLTLISQAWVHCDEDETIEENLIQPSEKYMIYKQDRDGQMGVTPQFWMICMDLMEKQHHFHTAVQEGNFDGRICA